MNFTIPHLPYRTPKPSGTFGAKTGAQPRYKGLTMLIDKGLSMAETEALIESASPYIDLVKLGWSTACLVPRLKEKLALFTQVGIIPYLGGTLFEVFTVRNAFDDFRRLLDTYQLEFVEVSDGSLTLPHNEKCNYIRTLAKDYQVLSEVGSKDDKKIIPPYLWIEQMQTELEAGAWKVIGEARESGTIGLFRSSGEVRQGLVEEILTQVPAESIIWEAPQKSQQVWFIKLLGANANLGNILPSDAIALETLRLGIRSDTFNTFYTPPA